MRPIAKTIATTLSKLEEQERGTDHPYARRSIAEWRSDAERERLPVTNTHDDKGASVLDVSATLAHDHHDARLGRK